MLDLIKLYIILVSFDKFNLVGLPAVATRPVTKMCWRQGYSVNRAPFIKQNYVQKAGSRLTFTRVPNTSGHVDMYYLALAKLPGGYSAHPYIMKGGGGGGINSPQENETTPSILVVAETDTVHL